MIQSIGKTGGGSRIRTKAAIAVLNWNPATFAGLNVSPIGNIAFGDPYFRMETGSNWIISFSWNFLYRASIAQSTANSVEFRAGGGGSINNIVESNDSSAVNACATPSAAASISGSGVEYDSRSDSDKRITMGVDMDGGIGGTVCERDGSAEMLILFLDGIDSIQSINPTAGQNAAFSHRFL